MIMNYDKNYPLANPTTDVFIVCKISAHGAKRLSDKDLNVHSASTLYNVHSCN